MPPKAAPPTRETSAKEKNRDHITCCKCSKICHYSNECTKDIEHGKKFLNNQENDNHEDECGDCIFTNILCN